MIRPRNPRVEIASQITKTRLNQKSVTKLHRYGPTLMIIQVKANWLQRSVFSLWRNAITDGKSKWLIERARQW